MLKQYEDVDTGWADGLPVGYEYHAPPKPAEPEQAPMAAVDAVSRDYVPTGPVNEMPIKPLPDKHVAGMGPGLTTEQALGVVATKLAPKVTEASIVAKIEAVRYITDEITTICMIHMRNGFKVIGTSTPASPENFSSDVGKRLAYDNAFRQLWPLEGYLLREKLSEERQALIDQQHS